jgi:hypothetical protein
LEKEGWSKISKLRLAVSVVLAGVSSVLTIHEAEVEAEVEAEASYS